MEPIHFIDLHCDTITNAMNNGKVLARNDLHISLERLPRGSRWCQLFALFLPDEYRGQDAIDYYDRCLAFYREQMALNGDRILPCETAAEVEKAFAQGKFASILAVEGGSAVAGQLDRVDLLRKNGVRFMTLTWNGKNEIASGSTTEEGFSAFGREAVRRMEEVGIVVDVSHLNDTGFGELCKFARKPFIATHSNVRAICGHKRNLTDSQFREIVDRGGIVGLNYTKSFIRDDGEDGTVEDLLRHVDHMLELGGENTIALGSDFDGTHVPSYLTSLDKTAYLRDSLLAHGFGEELTGKILFDNAMRFMKDNL